jgi:hypothetical protein
MSVTNPLDGFGLDGAPVVELRQYTLEPGMTETLIDVFEEHFVEGQERTGITIGGLFRDLDRPDRFVWMRGFRSMEARRSALHDFYTGPVWKQHGPTANSTMIDSDDVLLLRPTRPPHPPLQPRPQSQSQTRAPGGDAAGAGEARVLMNICVHEAGQGTCEWLAAVAQPVLEATLGTAVATWCTEPAPNSYPALPVREEHTFVWTATFPDQTGQDRAVARLGASRELTLAEMSQRVASTLALRLAPTVRSRHPGAGAR